MADDSEFFPEANLAHKGTFEAYPKSLAEVKADRSGSGADWTPRDVLIDMLRNIDSGALDLDEIIVCYSFKKTDGIYYTFSAATHSKLHGMLGILDLVKHELMTKGK